MDEGRPKADNVKTRKMLTLCGAFHKRGSVGRLYLKRKEEAGV